MDSSDYHDGSESSGRCAKHIYRYLNEMKSLAWDPKDAETTEFDSPKQTLPKNIKFDTKTMPVRGGVAVSAR